MSVAVMTAAFANSQSKGAARLALLALADEASAQGEISAYRRSQSWLMAKCNLSRAGLQKALRDLVELGELEVLQIGDGHRQASYQIHLMGLTEEAPGRTAVSPRGSSGEPPSSRSLPVTPVTSCPPSADVSVDERFAKFWEHYPRKVGKPGAKVAFRAMLKKGHLTQARKGLMNWNGYWQTAQTPVSMIPHPATWLRDERYDNDPPAIPGWGAPAANGSGKHRDAGKVVYDGANNRFEIQHDGTRVLLATSDEVNAEFAATDWNDIS